MQKDRVIISEQFCRSVHEVLTGLAKEMQNSILTGKKSLRSGAQGLKIISFAPGD